MFEMKCFGWNSGHGWVWVKLISIQNFKLWLLDHPQSWKRRKNLGIRNRKTSPNSVFLYNYSLVRLVWQNTEELISRPFAGLYKIRLLLRDRKRTKNFRFYLALLQLQLCLQLQQNTMVPVDVDGQICHFCSQGFVREQSWSWSNAKTNLRFLVLIRSRSSNRILYRPINGR